MPDPSLESLLEVAVGAARAAGLHTLKYFKTDLSIETKSDNTPVTRADREAEQIIRGIVGEKFPKHTILGEEDGEKLGADSRFRWIIDPIDGTKSFIHGVPLYGTLIGVEIDGRPKVGVCYIPAMDEMLAAAAGLGCHWNGKRANVSPIERLEDATLLVGSPVSAMRRSDAFERLAARAKLTRGWGDCYGYVLVATGRAEVMIDPAMNLWDCAPLLPILQEAGGHFTDWKGVATIHRPEAAGTNAGVHRQVIDILRGETRRG